MLSCRPLASTFGDRSIKPSCSMRPSLGSEGRSSRWLSPSSSREPCWASAIKSPSHRLDPNAFATGPTKNNSMVAVSTGLLQNLNEEEVRSVLAHEMGHVWNGDMFTTTVLAGLMNTFVYFIAMWVRRLFEERDQAMLGFIVSIVLQIALSMLAMIVINWHSRKREFEADRFSGKAYGPAPMISALESIQRYVEAAQVEYSTQDALATMKISGGTGGWMNLFATHPPIEERIAALRRLA